MNKILILIFTILFVLNKNTPILAQPGTEKDEFNRKRHWVGGTYGHPYTTFDRHNGRTFLETMEKIRIRIKQEYDSINLNHGPVFKAYQLVYNHAMLPRPLDNGIRYGSAHSTLALWAKNNAFVMLVGLNGNGDTLSLHERQLCKDRVIDAFNNMSKEIPHKDGKYYTYFLGLGLTGIHPILGSLVVSAALIQQVYEETNVKNEFKFYSRSLILWLQAYDLLKASAALPELASIKYFDNGNSDANKGRQSPRNKLRSQTRNLYKMSKGALGIVTHRYGWKQNHGVASASALLMAAQVLNDAGVETNVLQGNFLFRIVGGMGHNPNYSPVNWHKFAREGIQENLFVGYQWWPRDNLPTSPKKTEPDQFSPYSEGPVYASYGLLDCAIPAMRAEQNFYPNWSDEPLLKKNEINNIFNWVNAISKGHNDLPTYDGSRPDGKGWELSLTNNKSMNYGHSGDIRSNTADYIALIGGNDIPMSTAKKEQMDNELAKEGNIILRNTTEKGEYYFHMVAEKGVAIANKSGLFGLGGTHEEPDLGSFMISAGNNAASMVDLGIDPPSFGWSEADNTNKYWMHNVIEIDNGSPKNDDGDFSNPKILEIKRKGYFSKEFTLKYDYDENLTDIIKRNVIEHKNGENIYYVVNDYIDATWMFFGDFQGIRLNFNGNGRADFENSFIQTNNLNTWKAPCASNTWKITSHHVALGGGLSGTGAWSLPQASNTENGTKASTIAGGYLTRLQFFQPGKRKTIFQSAYFPQRCSDSLPIVYKMDEFTDKVVTIVDFVNKVDTFEAQNGGKAINPTVNDTVSHLHVSKWDGNAADSLVNPFVKSYMANKTLYFDGSKIFVERHSLNYMGAGFKYCPPSYIGIRNFITNACSYLIFEDTLFHSSVPLNFDFAILGKEFYQCNITTSGTITSSDSLKIKLPDVRRGLDMIALIDNTKDTLHGRYDSLTNYITLALKEGDYSITIQTKQTCSDCYFPPVGTHIDTTFTADDGLTHTLGIPKKINYPYGNLEISNGTKINMCEGVYLLNKDSLILTGPAQSKGMLIPSCYGIDSIAQGSNNSMLIVSQASALVLDAGSKTYVKNGGAIYVKQNGSLIIKDGAYVQIGDSGTGGWGEIIVEAGGNVYIEPNAHIEYRRTAGDTADRNIFSIATQTAYAGVYFIMDSILKAENILPATIYPTPICSLDAVNPVKNKEWGYTNFAKPLATFQTRKDTLCPGEPLYIKLNRILNDAQAQIKVCRVDSILLADDGGNSYWQDTCIEDSILVDLILPDPTCVTPRITPEDLVYFFKPNSLNRVSISVINECGVIHDTLAYIFVSDTPKVKVSVPTMACEGIGTAYMRVLNKPQEAVRYAFELTEFLDSSSYYLATYNPAKVYTYSTIGVLPDTFYFTDYYFKGGRKYLASLSVIGACGSVDVYDTIHIPSGVAISLSKPKAYASPINGATSIQLNAHISVADSFRWEPNTWLNRTDTTQIISTPEDSIDYWIIAKYGACTATDTVRILYNRIANAGLNDTLCYTEDSILLGNSYDMSILLGCLYYIGGSEFYDMYKNYTHTDPGYFRYFTHFMMHLERINDWSNCGAIFLDNFKHEVLRRQIMSAPWYKEYYLNFMQMTDPEMASFDLFVSGINGNTTLQNNLLAQGNWGSHQICTEAMFEAYNTFLGSHIAEISCTWSKAADDTIIPINNGEEWFVLADKLTESTLYFQQVITPEYAEIDEVLILRDTLTEPLFVAAMQWDSTVFFLNYTQPESNANTYSWNFGDGSAPSTETNPMHTFAAFDSAFVVCLSASNKCGTNMHCDTIRVDSAGLTTTNFERPASSKNPSTHQANSSKIRAIKSEGIQLSNAPNPFLGSTQISWRILNHYNHAQLVVTDVMGKTVYTQSINKPIDNIQFNAGQLPAGIYYYSIILDNNSTKTKMMVNLH